jgi:N-acetylmuramoyl-L-alanine amidase
MKYFSSSIIIFIVLIILAGCAYNPYKITNRQYRKQAKTLAKTISRFPLPPIQSDSIVSPGYFAGTTNFNLRKPNFVILHHTAQASCSLTLRAFTHPPSLVSAHYVICKDGTVHQMLNDYLRAWHAGVAKWGNVTDINSSSIGIELDNMGNEPFTLLQMQSLYVLLDTLKLRYSIPPANFIGHGDIAPTRKNDPNIYFPWRELSERGFGLWYDDTSSIALPEQFDHLQALRMVGYDIKDSIAAFIAFKRHFVQDTMPVLLEPDKKVLYAVSKKYL